MFWTRPFRKPAGRAFASPISARAFVALQACAMIDTYGLRIVAATEPVVVQ